MLTLASWASVALITVAIVNLLLLGALVTLVFVVRSQLRKLREQAQPVIDEARSTLDMVKTVTSNMGQRVESISVNAGNLATGVTQRAERLTSDITERVEDITSDFTRSAGQITSDVTLSSEKVAATFTDRFDQVSADLTQKLHRIIGLGDRLASRIAARLDTTTSVMEEAVTRPMITLAGVRAGIGKGLDVWRELSKRAGGDGKKRRREERETAARRMMEEAPPVVPQVEGIEG